MKEGFFKLGEHLTERSYKISSNDFLHMIENEFSKRTKTNNLEIENLKVRNEENDSFSRLFKIEKQRTGRSYEISSSVFCSW